MSLVWNDALVEQVKRAAMRGVVQATEAVRTEAVSLVLSTEKSGRIYRRRGITHQASAPGEPPASDTGRLVNAIDTTYDTARLTGMVNASTAYAAFLEYGTRKMAPRPFMRPALFNKRDEIETVIKEAVAGVIG